MTEPDTVFTVDLSRAQGKADLMSALKRALKFPAHFGYNWDALYDSLADLPPRSVIVLSGLEQYRERHPGLARMLESVLQDAARERQQSGQSLSVQVPGKAD